MKDFELLDTRGYDDGDEWDKAYYFKYKNKYFMFEDYKIFENHMHYIVQMTKEMIFMGTFGATFELPFDYDDEEFINELIENAEKVLNSGDDRLEYEVA